MSGNRSGGGRVVRGVVTILIAVIIWFLPPPAGVAVKAWHLLAIFAATIVGLIPQPLPMGAVVIIGTTATALTGTLSPAHALNGFSNTTVWLIFAAYMLALAIYEGVDKVGIWGVDLHCDSEYSYQRPNMEYLIGLARGRGMKVIGQPIRPRSAL